MTRDPLFVFYDGGCDLCAGALAWALRRDALGLVRPVAVPSPEAERVLGPSTVHALEALHAWSEHSGLVTGPDAVAALLARLPRWGWAGALLGAPLVRSLARPAYRMVARHRYAFDRPGCALPRR
ncbi:MAG TPA: DUF393 domain-containing protein [Candidatus Eisenbacteria bacterium]|nr:DUF393 domain-containing protein [Candidatus Eisenbacteria bacterium]